MCRDYGLYPIYPKQAERKTCAHFIFFPEPRYIIQFECLCRRPANGAVKYLDSQGKDHAIQPSSLHRFAPGECAGSDILCGWGEFVEKAAGNRVGRSGLRFGQTAFGEGLESSSGLEQAHRRLRKMVSQNDMSTVSTHNTNSLGCKVADPCCLRNSFSVSAADVSVL